jgi:hypothetical protein
MGNIFISYRRQDSAQEARTLHRLLSEHYSESSVFLDVTENIPPGRNFIQLLEERISSCDVFLPLIGPSWNPTDSKGNGRLADPLDPVRIEISTALTSPVEVIPILIQNAIMPRRSQLPKQLRGLAEKEAVALPRKNFEREALQLISQMEKSISTSVEAGSGSTLFRLELRDVLGERIAAPAEIVLRNQSVPEIKQFHNVFGSDRVVIRGLAGPPGKPYVLDVQTPVHRPVRWTVEGSTWKEDKVTEIVLPMNRTTAVADFPEFDELSEKMQELLSTMKHRRSVANARSTYKNIEPLAKANLFNCLAQANSVLLSDGRTLAMTFEPSATILLKINPNYVLLRISNEVAAQIGTSAQAGFLRPVPAQLHSAPAGYTTVAAVRTYDLFLSFQLTISAGSTDHALEMGFDENLGLLAVFRATNWNEFDAVGPIPHPFDVHQLLIRHLQIDPGYRLKTHVPLVKTLI